MVEDIEVLMKNCKEYARAVNGVEILRRANGKSRYTEISKALGVHKTTVSGMLKKAEKLGLAKKVEPGIYKKIPGILGYIPSASGSWENSVAPATLASKIARKPIKLKLPQGLKVPLKMQSDLNKMSSAYGCLYVTENILRKLIRDVIGQKPDWWKKYIPSSIQVSVAKSIKNEPYDAVKKSDELEYTHLGQLKEIIIFGKNWNDFLPHLNEQNKASFSVMIDKAIPSRNGVGHCIPLTEEDLKISDVRFLEIVKMIK